ncbi:helix-turn-helix domain-containing protein [Desulfovibrio fairfieldensis]|uniref:helix-turn-helix domain-containing protein n=1 Tax=Desulfovibrio fairfieldensis TaxID=44742 RepID=UPI0009F8204C|nr:helix-turn-helix domain-containing protein [Desulfovibrio fairfieldensis]
MPTPLDRVFEAAGCRTQVELADFLGIKQSSIALAKKKGRVPAEWLLTLWRKRRVNPDWVLKGLEAKFLQPTDCAECVQLKHVCVKQVLSPYEYSFEELMAEIVSRIAIKLNK